MKLVMNGRRAAWGGSFAAVLALAISLPALSLAGTSGKAAKQSIVWLELGSGNPYWDAQHQAADAQKCQDSRKTAQQVTGVG